MIINLGDAPFKAYIKVTYPKGSCTCTLGSTSFSHSGGGTATFEVNKKGTWKVEAVSNTIVRSASVVISSNKETKTVSLDYTQWLYNAGNEYSSVTGGWTAKAMAESGKSNGVAPGLSKGTSTMSITPTVGKNDGVNSPSSNGIVRTTNKINLTDYKTLTVVLSGSVVAYAWAEIVVYSSMSSYSTSSVKARKRIGGGTSATSVAGTHNISVESLSGDHYVGIVVHNGNTYTQSFTMSGAKLVPKG